MKMNEQESTNEDITVQLLNINGDVIELEEVTFIKIKSKQYNLIIMKDYLPIIGEVQGIVEICMKDDNIVLQNIIGYYMHKHNKFNLFYREEI